MLPIRVVLNIDDIIYRDPGLCSTFSPQQHCFQLLHSPMFLLEIGAASLVDSRHGCILIDTQELWRFKICFKMALSIIIKQTFHSTHQMPILINFPLKPAFTVSWIKKKSEQEE